MAVKTRIAIIAALTALPFVLAGCQSSATTQLDWGTKHTRVQARATVKPKPQRYVSYEPKPRCVCDDVPVPSARPSNASYASYVPTPRPSKADAPAASDPDANFMWPVRGRIVENFGTGANGQRNDGINIAAPEGTPIVAAADGTVSYSGNEVRSYGNLMLLRHGSGYVTAYAHADHFVVGKGEYVSKGQIIGYVGATGDVTAPQLHFELRKGQRGETPLNPRPYLGPLQVAAR